MLLKLFWNKGFKCTIRGFEVISSNINVENWFWFELFFIELQKCFLCVMKLLRVLDFDFIDIGAGIFSLSIAISVEDKKKPKQTTQCNSRIIDIKNKKNNFSYP